MADLNDLTQNVNIWDDAKNKAVSIVTDGSIERLAVDTKGVVLGSVNLAQFRAKTDFSFVETVPLSTSLDTTIVDVSDEGKVDFVAVRFSNNRGIVALEIDSVEVYRLPVVDINSIMGLSSNNSNALIHTVTDREFRDVYFEGADFTSGFKIHVRASGSPEPTVIGHFVKYRGKV